MNAQGLILFCEVAKMGIKKNKWGTYLLFFMIFIKADLYLLKDVLTLKPLGRINYMQDNYCSASAISDILARLVYKTFLKNKISPSVM